MRVCRMILFVLVSTNEPSVNCTVQRIKKENHAVEWHHAHRRQHHRLWHFPHAYLGAYLLGFARNGTHFLVRFGPVLVNWRDLLC